jgi:hypothetical protein
LPPICPSQDIEARTSTARRTLCANALAPLVTPHRIPVDGPNRFRKFKSRSENMRALRIEDDRYAAPPVEPTVTPERLTCPRASRFSTLYLRPGDPTPDSSRARHRVGALLGEPVFKHEVEQLAGYLGLELGVAIPGDGRLSSAWQQYMRECSVAQFLDTVTLVYRHLFYHASADTADQWRDRVRRVFAEENLAYEIDDIGGVHPAVDREFQRNSASAIAGIESDRYDRARELFERASNHLGDPPNYVQAWRAMFSALDAVFILMFPYARLTAEDIDRRLRPLVQRAYAADPTALRAAHKMLAGLRDWVDASHLYRHQPGAAEPAQPPADIAVLAISHGASFLRWLAGLDEERPAERLRLVHDIRCAAPEDGDGTAPAETHPA